MIDAEMTPLPQGDPIFPVIEGFGGVYPLNEVAERPGRAVGYSVVFSISKPAPAPGQVNPGLDRLAHLMNLFGLHGVRLAPGHVVAIVHDGATPSILKDPAYRASEGVGNPNGPLIRRLCEAGADVRVCGRALAGHNFKPAKVARGVQVEVSAVDTIPDLISRGFALVPV